MIEVKNMTISAMVSLIKELTNINRVDCIIFDAFVSGNMRKINDNNLTSLLQKARTQAEQMGYIF